MGRNENKRLSHQRLAPDAWIHCVVADMSHLQDACYGLNMLRLSQDRHPLPTTLRAKPLYQRRTLLPSTNMGPHAMVTECSTVLGRPNSHAERHRITTVPYALTTGCGIGGSHFHPRRSSGGCKPDVPPGAHTTLQKPISRSLSWTFIVGPRIHAGPPPVMGVNYSGRPISAAYRGDSDQTSNSEHRHPVPDDKEQDGVCPAVPLQAEEIQAHPHCRTLMASANPR